MPKKMNKRTISNLLMEQAKDCLSLAIKQRELGDINKEVQIAINIHLLLGIILEGIINEIGENCLDAWTLKELEKGSTPLKWRMISGLKNGFNPSSEPMQTIREIQKIRNKIAHPKSENQETDTIVISEIGEIKRHLNDEDLLPAGDLKLYIGFEKLVAEYNARISLFNMIRVLKAIIEIKELLKLDDKFEWSLLMLKEISEIKIVKNEFDK